MLDTHDDMVKLLAHADHGQTESHDQPAIMSVSLRDISDAGTPFVRLCCCKYACACSCDSGAVSQAEFLS